MQRSRIDLRGLRHTTINLGNSWRARTALPKLERPVVKLYKSVNLENALRLKEIS